VSGEIGPEHAYGPQGDLSHLSKIYGELCLDLHARRAGFALGILRLGIVYGPSPVEHERADSQTVVDKFRRLAARGEPLPVDDGGRATIGVVHVDDVARILLHASSGTANVAAESVTVAAVAALARGESPSGKASATFATPFSYRHRLADYLRS
jgi:nucleoside-diphosphate-sugar epimerase